jgi:glycosyltransferase involved in cell wall biosynthesis
MPARPRVLFLLHLPPPTHGSSLVGLSIKDSKAIHAEFDCAYVNLLASKQVAESGKVSVGKLFRFALIWWAVLREVVFSRPKICYLALSTTGVAFLRDVLIIATLRLFGVRRVFHLHNKGVSAQRSGLLSKLLYPFAFGGAQVILLSPRLYADVQRYVPRERIHICPNGIASAVAATEPHGSGTADEVQLLFLSNLIESKGVFDLLDACALLKQKGLAFRCTLVGGEGDIGAERLRLAIESGEIFVLPTYYPSECFPLVLLEAMSHGLVVVTTDEGGIPDIVDDGSTGFVVAARNPPALAQRLAQLIESRVLRGEMGQQARRKYLRDFTLESFERRFLSILSQVVQRP